MFLQIVKDNFGIFITESSSSDSPPKSPTVSNHAQLSPLDMSAVVLSKPASLTNGSPISMPTSMQSSFEGEMANNLQHFNQVRSTTCSCLSVNNAVC